MAALAEAEAPLAASSAPYSSQEWASQGSEEKDTPPKARRSVWVISPRRLSVPPSLERLISEEDIEVDNWFIIRVLVLLVVLVAFPFLCRFAELDSPIRCLVLTVSILMINLAEVMPLYVTALMVPVLGTLYSVLGDERTTTETSTLLVANIFNNTSFMVLGALVINGIFTKCGLEQRFMSWLLRNYLLDGPIFLLLLTFGGMFMCSVLYSGSLVLVAALTPTLKEGIKSRLIDGNTAKRILLSVAFAANAGSCLLPISSPVNLIAVSLLADFGFAISVNTWAAITIPVAVLVMFGTWLAFLAIFPSGNGKKDMTEDEVWARQLAMLPSEHVVLTDWHLLFLGIGVLAVFGITVFPTQLEPIIGHPACLSLAVVVVVFGSGYMSREEFCQLDWDLLALVGGINVMAFLIRETGLGVLMADSLERSGLVETLPFQVVLAIFIVITISISTFLGHSVTGVLLLPLVMALGIKLGAPQTTGIIVAAAVPFGMSWSNSSFDNVVCFNESKKLGKKKARLHNRDFYVVGFWNSIFAALLFSTLGFKIAGHYYSTPGMEALATPIKLKPNVVRENLPGPKDWKALEPLEHKKQPAEVVKVLGKIVLERNPWHTWGSAGRPPRQRRSSMSGVQKF